MSAASAAPPSPTYLPVRQAWLDRRTEPILEPELPIVDPHHHLWDRPDWRYLLDELLADTSSGHNIVATVYRAGPRDVSRNRPRRDAPRRRDRVRQWRRRHERQRHLRQDQALRRHRRPCRPDARQPRGAGARGPHPRRRRPLPRHPPHHRLGRRCLRPQSRLQPAARVCSATRASARASPFSAASASPSTPGSIIRRSVSLPILRAPSRQRRSSSTTSAGRSASAPTPASATRCLPPGRHRSRRSPPARMSVSSSAGSACAWAGSAFTSSPSRPPRESVGGGVATLCRDLHRGLRGVALHVREQLPRRQGLLQLSRVLERLQAPRQRRKPGARRPICSPGRPHASIASTCPADAKSLVYLLYAVSWVAARARYNHWRNESVNQHRQARNSVPFRGRLILYITSAVS